MWVLFQPTFFLAGASKQVSPPTSFQHLPSALRVFQNSTCRVWAHLLLWEIFFFLLGFCNLAPLSVPFLPSSPWMCLSFHFLFSWDAIHSSPAFSLSGPVPLLPTNFYSSGTVTSKKMKNSDYSALSPKHPRQASYFSSDTLLYDSFRLHILEWCYSFNKY